jgi:hypothetical protein
MPGCVFHVSGQDFGVDEFLEATSLKPNQVWRRGEVRNRKGEICEHSGFSMNVSEIDGDLAGQCEDAIIFLRRHKAELAQLAALPGANDRRLDFGYDRRDVAVQCDYLPPELLALAGSLGIGIELSLYPQSESGH